MLHAIITILIGALRLLQVLCLIRAVLSWLPEPRASRFGSFVFRITEPVYLRAWRLLDQIGLSWLASFTPILLIFVLEVVARILRFLG